MLTIRLQRVGKTKHASYRLIISEKARDTQDVYLELLGTFDPHAKEGGIKFKADRIKYWIDKGAETSDTVHNLLVESNIIEGKKKKSVYLSGTRKTKIAEKKKADDAKSAADVPAPAAEAPAISAPEVPAAPAV